MDKLKMWVALVGAVLTGVLSVVGPDGPVGYVLGLVYAIVTAVAVYLAKNAESDA